MKKAVQYFSAEYLSQCRKMSPKDIVEFLEGFRELHAGRVNADGLAGAGKSRLISLKIPQHFLDAFRLKAELEGVRVPDPDQTADAALATWRMSPCRSSFLGGAGSMRSLHEAVFRVKRLELPAFFFYVVPKFGPFRGIRGEIQKGEDFSKLVLEGQSFLGKTGLRISWYCHALKT